MTMNQIIQEKRKMLGLTQEQVADYLGVSTPAVSKWETGASCPDLALLSPLARLLKTDLNTLLCFRENLSREEMFRFCRELSALDCAEAFRLAEERLREYPGDEELMLTLAMHLDGLVTTAGEKGFDERLENWYHRVENSEDIRLRSAAQVMLVSRLIRREAYAQAQAVLDRIPDRENPMTMDKVLYQTTIDQCTGRGEQAAEALQDALLLAANRVLLLLTRLVGAELSLGDAGAARAVAEKAEAFASTMELWGLHQGSAMLPVALKEKNAEESLKLTEQVLRASLNPWQVENTTLYHRLAPQYRNVHMDHRVLESLIPNMEQDPAYDFLREDPRFRGLVEEFKEKLKKSVSS